MRFISILIVAMIFNSCNIGFTTKKVHTASGAIPELPRIDIAEPDRFLNDIMLSPYWKVEKERDGSFVAKARSIGQDWPFDSNGSFLFEFMSGPNHDLPKDYRIFNNYLSGDKIFSSFQIKVVFQKPDFKHIALGESGQKINIPVYEPFDTKLGPNSFSDLAIRLSRRYEIYVILHEQGSDTHRKTSFAKILSSMKELEDLASTPETYRAEERYAGFFRTFFDPLLKDQEIMRFPGRQDRDTFYGYFRVIPDTSYAGVNIKISHPVYCPNEGTRSWSRLQKAEYLGKPYQSKDIVFFLIEDNAVYLSDDHNQRFGIFTGEESFEGDLEVLNDKLEVLLKTKGQFKGWQR